MCPLCMVVVSRTEAEMLSHLLADHPLALLVVSVCLAVANVALANRPADLLLVDATVLGCAVAYVRAPGLFS